MQKVTSEAPCRILRKIKVLRLTPLSNGALGVSDCAELEPGLPVEVFDDLHHAATKVRCDGVFYLVPAVALTWSFAAPHVDGPEQEVVGAVRRDNKETFYRKFWGRIVGRGLEESLGCGFTLLRNANARSAKGA
jgi:hypothetical protein